LEQQRQDIPDVVEQQGREAQGLSRAVDDAERALEGEAGERALPRRAEALRASLQRIECPFTATGATGAAGGRRTPCWRG
jgi:hypothetical protein